MLVGTTSALGFGSTYLEKIDGERYFKIPINYEKSYFIYPQNKENNSATIIVNLTNEDGLIITNIQDEYNIPPNTESDGFPIEILMRFPSDAQENDQFKISYSIFASSGSSEGGVVQFAPVGYSKSFKVIADVPLVDNCIDNDGDGYDNCNPGVYGDDNKPLDCNDNDNTIYPNAPKLKDGKDNNCDGNVDDDEKLPPINGDDDEDDEDDDGWIPPVLKKNETNKETNETDTMVNENEALFKEIEDDSGKEKEIKETEEESTNIFPIIIFFIIIGIPAIGYFIFLWYFKEPKIPIGNSINHPIKDNLQDLQNKQNLNNLYDNDLYESE